MPMLVVGTLPRAIEPAVTQLEDASQTVARCHDSGARPFPCLALSEGRVRPLEEAPVDVAVTVRNRAWPRPSPFEDGAICALGCRIPLVVAGITALYPFDRWSARTLEDGSDLVAACEQAAAAPLPRHGEVTGQAARQVLAAASRPPIWRPACGGARAGCKPRSPSPLAALTSPPRWRLGSPARSANSTDSQLPSTYE